jgi:predicted acylesterase/phospholipase RssA
MADRICDLVMEGGVTSGIVYPNAIVKLSREYLFHSIGGTSAGAIAAAATAAAEYRRRGSGDRGGFDRLERLPQDLAPPPGADAKQSKLFGLFSPQKTTAALFTVLASALNCTNRLSRLGAVLVGFLRAFWASALLGALVVLVPAWFLAAPLNAWGWALVLMLALLVALIGALLRLFFTLAGAFLRNGFGICRGYTPGDEQKFAHGAQGEPLTLWLSRLINECAGLPVDGPPLTFGMLWNAPGFPPDWLQQAVGARSRRSIDLQMVATSLTHGRPFRFPDADPDVPFYVALDELEPYFPPNVMQCIADVSSRPERSYPGIPLATPGLRGKVVLPLASLPVVVAARMSLSFPFLLSAVPLYSVDFMVDASGKQQWEVKPCWFSDGGLTSNFPIHFFDAALPLWPTFGISLETQDPRHQPEPVWMPANNQAGRADPWDDFAAPQAGILGGVDTLFRFVGALLGSIRNWQDRLNARSPGTRDRVVRIRLADAEGGMNLAMSRAQIDVVAGKGAMAADELLARYCGIGKPALPLLHPMDLDNHRWVRLRSFVGALERLAPGLNVALQVTPPQANAWANLVQLATTWTQVPDRCPVTPTEATLVTADLGALQTLATTIATPPGTSATAPKRQPVLRLRPDV